MNVTRRRGPAGDRPKHWFGNGSVAQKTGLLRLFGLNIEVIFCLLIDLRQTVRRLPDTRYVCCIYSVPVCLVEK